MKVKTRIILAVLLVSISFLSVVTFITYLSTKSAITNSVLNNLDSIATIQKNRIIDNLNDSKEKMFLIKNRIAVRENLINYKKNKNSFNLKKVRENLLLSIYPNGFVKNFSILNTKGIVISSTDLSLVNKDYSKEPVFIKGSKSDSLDNFYIDENKKPSVYLSSPIKYNNETIGIILIDSYADKLLSITSDHTGLGETGEITMGKRMANGNALSIAPLRYNPDGFLGLVIPKNAVHRPIILALKGEETIFPNLINYRGKRILSATRYLKDVDWGLTVNIDHDEVFMPIYELQRLMVFLILSATLLLIITSIYLSEQITKSFRKLTETVYKISEGDLTQRITINSNDEIGYMATAFNQMTENLEIKFNEANQLNKYLNDEIIYRRQVEAELKKFAYISSHDLQEPLRSIVSYVELLEKRYKDKLDERGLTYINSVVKASKTMKYLINDLLTYSRLGNEQSDFKSIDLNNIISHVIEILKVSIEENNAVIEYPNMPVITANYILMIQLFQNLISNAIKYRSDKSPVIKISFEEMENEWLFKISDNGIGIDSQFFDKIFVIFQRLHGKNEYEGTGIGLTICKKIIDIHNGRIWLESELNKGTDFYFTIKK